MENASKALLIASGTLLGMMILSLAVYLYTTFNTTAEEIKSQLENDRISQFNVQFTSYLGREDITIYEIIDIANLAKKNNDEYELTDIADTIAGNPETYYVTVTVEINGGSSKEKIENLVETEKINWITNDLARIGPSTNKELPLYKCIAVEISDITKRVYKIVIESL